MNAKGAMPEKTGYYKSYMLRMWRESLEGEWRASLQDVVTSESHNFPSVKAMMEYLAVENKLRPSLKIQIGEVFME